MKILLKLLLLCALIFENTINQIEAGKINQEKSFDEIFGQKWDDRTEENMCPIDQIIHKQKTDQNNQFGQNHQQSYQNFDENLEVKEEENEEMSTGYDELGGQLPRQTKNEQIYDHFSNEIENKKREIVEKFHLIKEKIKQKEKKYSRKEWNKIELKIAKKLGTKREKIYNWKREFGMVMKKKYSIEAKQKVLKQFGQIYGKIKMKLNEKLEGKREKYQKIIAKHLGICLNSIYKWKRQFKNGKLLKNQRIDEQKRESVEKYFKIKYEFMQMGKHSPKEWNEFNANIKNIFGVSYKTIERCAKKIGLNQNESKGMI